MKQIIKPITTPRVIDPQKPHATIDDLAAHFNVGRRTIENWIAAEPPIPHYRRGYVIRFSITEVETFLQKQKAASN